MDRQTYDRMEAALKHMEAALDLLDGCSAPPLTTLAYLDFAIHTLAELVEPSAEQREHRLRKALEATTP
jgi:hypothetical protein